MGLAGQKRRTKLSHDPNNTAWSKSTDNYGHKILTAQGWKPGDYLGAENASHAAHYTAANASHIRVALREDNMGLGAQKGTSNAETFGLSTLSGIFGRLNGKTDGELQKQQDAQRDVQLRTYQARKMGLMTFVSGGLLVGEKMEFPQLVEEASSSAKSSAPIVDILKDGARADDAGTKPATTSKKSKKRKADASMEDSSDPSYRDKKKKKRRGRESEVETNNNSTSDEDAEPSRSIKRSKKPSSERRSADEKARAKEEKRARKEERRKRKEDKRRAKNDLTTPISTSDVTPLSEMASPPTSHAPTPVLFAGSRHAVRQRYIMQKRMASLDPQALKEILMLKAVA